MYTILIKLIYEMEFLPYGGDNLAGLGGLFGYKTSIREKIRLIFEMVILQLITLREVFLSEYG